MQTLNDVYDRRRNRGFGHENDDDLDLDQREGDARRRSQRLPLRLWTEGRVKERLDFHNCSNLSEDGMFIENPEPYDVGTRVHIEFNLPGLQEAISARSIAVSALTDEGPGENIMGNGFRFEAISAHDREAIRIFVESAQRG